MFGGPPRALVQPRELEEGALGLRGPLERVLEHLLRLVGAVELEQHPSRDGGGLRCACRIEVDVVRGGDERRHGLRQPSLSGHQTPERLRGRGVFGLLLQRGAVVCLGLGLELVMDREQVPEQRAKGRAVRLGDRDE